MWTNLFWREMTLIFLTYLSKLILVSIVYYLLLFPFVLGINTVMWGPLGITVAVVHSILQVNMYASTLTRLHSAKYAPLVMERLTSVKTQSNPAVVVHPNSVSTAQQTISVKPKRHLAKAAFSFMVKLGFKMTYFTSLFFLSLVPIVGILLVRISRSGTIGYLYSVPFLAAQRPRPLKKGETFYQDLGKNIAFGVVSGILELLPVLSGLCIATNYVGRGLWILDERVFNSIHEFHRRSL
ncbi:uncharacterized protein LALA0_S09e07206g [Lachancea lanzarotensis]|uniref:LALA0S09e07206g1_1 n=1 Tax=Lachancea lanzarotensis TaxID=1245769 RepID=A0A0C7N7Y3_9SACH|nr:uncharacterized protein LALA0_S09e07206g [Lachancea lanzarotensis]CEP63993.1 LALA0S09e07206g1_1 [Lachancea lanzarotensis]